MDEVDKLLKTGFIREMYYLEWLANVIMVKGKQFENGECTWTSSI